MCKENGKNFTCFYDMLKKYEKVNMTLDLYTENIKIYP